VREWDVVDKIIISFFHLILDVIAATGLVFKDTCHLAKSFKLLNGITGATWWFHYSAGSLDPLINNVSSGSGLSLVTLTTFHGSTMRMSTQKLRHNSLLDLFVALDEKKKRMLDKSYE
jgi:hypothetical protein